MDSLHQEIDELTSRTSRFYVPVPNKRIVIEDFIKGFIRFQAAVRWADFFRNRSDSSTPDSNRMHLSLHTNLRPSRKKSPPIGSKDAEAFLEEVPVDAERLKKAVGEEDYYNAYQAAHKMKPTVDLFELGVLQDLIVVQDWGKFEKHGEDCSRELELVLTAVENATAELKEDFNL